LFALGLSKGYPHPWENYATFGGGKEIILVLPTGRENEDSSQEMNYDGPGEIGVHLA
jgi:hypothetical protein